jgi:hypothetical protein
MVAMAEAMDEVEPRHPGDAEVPHGRPGLPGDACSAISGLCGNNSDESLHTLDNEPKAEHSCERGSKKGGGTNGRERLAEVILPMLREALD